MRTALIHYWLVRMRGGEQVLKHLMRLHGDADIFTNVFEPAGMDELFGGREPPFTTSINRWPFAAQAYPLYVPFMPAALERLDMSKYDLIISSEAGPAKWVIPAPGARHVSYVHSPMRYLWDQRFIYRSKVPALARPLFDRVTEDMRYKDMASANRVDDFVANSTFVGRRIAQYYGRPATVIPPPVEQDDIGPPQAPEDFYLFAGQLVSYKAARLAVDACVRLGRRLVVVGDGPDKEYVRRFAGHHVDYRGRVSREELLKLMGTCRALLFPGIEDFGIIPVEVLASGRPVVALGRGGILDTVEDRVTGILYDGHEAKDLEKAIVAFEEWEPEFNPISAVNAARRFSPEAFEDRWRTLIDGTRTAALVDALNHSPHSTPGHRRSTDRRAGVPA